MLRKRVLQVLGIESSCDETAAAVVAVQRADVGRSLQFGFSVSASVIASQVAMHAKTGGVVPEVAAREHVLQIIPVIERALRDAYPSWRPPKHHGKRTKSARMFAGPPIDAIAVTAGPGLITALGVGVETARALTYVWRKPLIAVNHIEGHVLSALLEQAASGKRQASSHAGPENRSASSEPAARSLSLVFPAVALIVSGGHTELLLLRRWGAYRCVGATRDDAAGEAFDKVAKLLGLEYPGGPAVARRAVEGDVQAIDFPRGMIASGDFDFSFSGMKTAVRMCVERATHPADPKFVSDVCASFQQAAVDVLVAKTITAVTKYRARTVLLGGGVAANRALREQLATALALHPDVALHLPPLAYSGDNAAMIAAAGGVRLHLGKRTPWQEIAVDPNWELGR
ncbi:tRNA (adenosine(37)-N6)-threonylcarbamoyltransferase complex transferase subunit TsaD [Candidatus Uhrbacteria bacterium]|nr:tRNA (adenosine(37)-N6)-threonylcarbamoyltransferase complex transferase subunit TsaD [Candidatus Uhrbacteria bacterium]